jgi:hypothetical protein
MYRYKVIAETFVFMMFISQISALTTRIMNEVSCPSWPIHGKFSNLVASATFRRISFHYALTFKNLASYIRDGRTATFQMLNFIYFFQQI